MPAKVFLRSEFNYDTEEVSKSLGLVCKDVSRTVQADAKSADINFIVKGMMAGGVMPVRKGTPLQGDFADAPDFQSAMALIAEANQSFMALPAELRARFRNDPGAFVDFCSDEANADEIVKLGLAKRVPKAATEAVVPVPVAGAVPPKAA